MNINDISTQLLFTTVPIRCTKSTGESVGTGFLYSKKLSDGNTFPIIITNFHVIENMINGNIEFNVTTDGINPDLDKSIVISFGTDMSINKLGNLDLVAIPLVPFINSAEQQETKIFFKTVNEELFPDKKVIDELSAIEDVTFIGYPSGLYDNVNHLSIVRKGFSATPIWNDYKGKSDFLIDGGVFPGSSGSPVFIYNQGSYATNNGINVGTRLIFVGVIYETNISNGNFLNLGIAISSLAVKKELDLFFDRLK